MTVVLRWDGCPWSVAPVGEALRHRLGGRQVCWNGNGEQRACDVGFFVREGLRYVTFRVLDRITRLIAWVACASGPPKPPGSSNGDVRVVFVIPVLPDLSHTFIYREILAALREEPSARVVCLAAGQDMPVHPEAKELAEHTITVPRRGILRHYASILGWLVRHPRRAGAVFALYRHYRRGSVGDLLGKGPLRDPDHPGRGFALASVLRKLRAEHVHVYGSTYACNVTMEAACLLDVPFSISSYVDFDFYYDHKMLAEKYRLARFFRVCTRFCRTRIAEILALDDLSRVPVVLYGLDVTTWHARTADPQPGLLVSAARLVRKKGLHLVPPALALLVERHIPFSWSVAGDGPELVGLRKLVADLSLEEHVEFLGAVSNDTVRSLLGRADLALLPCIVAQDGERDGIPIFLTEAMALGVPVLTTPVSGIPELVRDGDTGFLVQSNNIEQLATRLEQVLGGRALMRDVALRGREELVTTHDIEQSARAVLAEIRRGPIA